MAILFITCCLAGGVAHAAAASEASITQRAQQACAAIGLNTSEALFVDCVRSLRHTARRAAYIDATGSARGACLAANFKPGTASFADCVLDRLSANP